MKLSEFNLALLNRLYPDISVTLTRAQAVGSSERRVLAMGSGPIIVAFSAQLVAWWAAESQSCHSETPE